MGALSCHLCAGEDPSHSQQTAGRETEAGGGTEVGSLHAPGAGAEPRGTESCNGEAGVPGGFEGVSPGLSPCNQRPPDFITTHSPGSWEWGSAKWLFCPMQG